jgi:anti-sigma factor ChrR (cupin superfamily)
LPSLQTVLPGQARDPAQVRADKPHGRTDFPEAKTGCVVFVSVWRDEQQGSAENN